MARRGRPVDAALPRPPQRRFTARLEPSLVRDKRALLENLATHREQVVDARAAGRFNGTTPEPGSVCAAAISRAAAMSPMSL